MRYSITGTSKQVKENDDLFIFNTLSNLINVSEISTGGAFWVDSYAAWWSHMIWDSSVLKRGVFPANQDYNNYCNNWVDIIEYVAGTYMDRNCRLVEHADILLAFPKTGTEERRSGTWATVRRARNPRKFGLDKDPIPVYVYPLNGDKPYVID